MNRNLFALAAGIVAMLLVASAQAEIITTGKTTGNYFKVGSKLSGMVPGTTVEPSKGSIENIEKMSANKAEIGLTQMDALAQYADKHPDIENSIAVVGPIYEECVYIAVNVDGPIQTEDDLQQDQAVIAVGAAGSGGVATWEYMRILEKGYQKAKVQFSGDTMTVGQLAMTTKFDPAGKKPNAYLFVTKPGIDNKLIGTIANNKKLKFIDVDDSDLNDKFPMTGEPVYKFKSVPYAKGTFGTKNVKTICMDSAVLVRRDMNPEMMEKIADIVVNYTNSIQ